MTAAIVVYTIVTHLSIVMILCHLNSTQYYMYNNDRSMYIYVRAAIVVYTIVTHLSIVMILGHLNRTQY